MAVTFGELERQASTLPPNEQAALVEALLEAVGRLDTLEIGEDWWQRVAEQARRHGRR